MKIEVNLYASLGKYRPAGVPSGPWIMEAAEGDTIGKMLDLLGVPAGEVKMIFRNGIHAARDTPLKEGDRVGIFPPVAGG